MANVCGSNMQVHVVRACMQEFNSIQDQWFIVEITRAVFYIRDGRLQYTAKL